MLYQLLRLRMSGNLKKATVFYLNANSSICVAVLKEVMINMGRDKQRFMFVSPIRDRSTCPVNSNLLHFICIKFTLSL